MVRFIFLFFALLQCLTGKEQKQREIELVRVNPSAYNQALKLRMQEIDPPFKENQKLIIECQAFALGQVLDSKFSEYDLRQNRFGSRLMVYVLSKNKINRFYVDRNNGLNVFEEKSYKSRMYTKKITKESLSGVKPGPVAFLVVPISSYNETIKAKEGFDSIVTSYKQDKSLKEFKKELLKPMIFYNQPIGVYEKGVPVLVDFYLLNCTLSRYYGYTVLVELKNMTTGKKVLKTQINNWSPYLLKNLEKGKYVLDLTLLYRGKKVDHPHYLPSRGKFVVK